ncbi:MAG: hemin uptake protein HemP [Pseudomonadota bacterium]
MERLEPNEVQRPQLPAHRAEDLTEGGNQANIVLNGQVYTLRITRAGKLILTK